MPTEVGDHERRPHALAVAVAAQLGDVLRECCVTLPGDDKPRMRVVGSVRRLKPTVKDLEILFIPSVVKVKDHESLLGELREASAVNVMLDALVTAGVLAKRLKCDGSATWGEDIRLAVHVASGLPVDFFAATRENWWNQLVCRTGEGKQHAHLRCGHCQGAEVGDYLGGFSMQAYGQDDSPGAE